MPETKIYNLHLPYEKETAAKAQPSNNSIAIIMEAPRHLSQSYIVFRNSPYQLTISKYSKWDAPPSDMVSRTFRDGLHASGIFKEVRIASSVPREFYALKINLKRFERIDEGDKSSGEILLDASLASPEGKELYRKTISKNAPLESRSFESLAKGLSILLAEAVEEIKAAAGKTIFK
jgi:uncharacterized lipoprotein YmbA